MKRYFVLYLIIVISTLNLSADLISNHSSNSNRGGTIVFQHSHTKDCIHQIIDVSSQKENNVLFFIENSSEDFEWENEESPSQTLSSFNLFISQQLLSFEELARSGLEIPSSKIFKNEKNKLYILNEVFLI